MKVTLTTARVPAEIVTGDPQTARATRIHGPLTVMWNSRPVQAEARWGYTDDEGRQFLGFAVRVRGSWVESSVAVLSEGALWIRGHYGKKSPEIQALKAAYALSPPQHPGEYEKG